jgi:hypothetical protein
LGAKPVFAANQNRFGTYAVMQGHEPPPDDVLLSRLIAAARKVDHPVFVFTEPLPIAIASSFGLFLVKRFEGAYLKDENYYVYLLADNAKAP